MSVEYAIEGLKKLRTGSLLSIVAVIVIMAGLITIAGTLFATAFAGGTNVLAVLASSITALACAVVGIILSLVALFAYLIPGYSRIADYSEGFRTVAKLFRVGLGYGLILLLIAIIVLAFVHFLPPLLWVAGGLSIVSAILIIIGFIAFVVGLFKLNSLFNESLFLVAGILMILSIFISFLSFIAFILIYVAAGSAIRKLRSSGSG